MHAAPAAAAAAANADPRVPPRDPSVQGFLLQLANTLNATATSDPLISTPDVNVLWHRRGSHYRNRDVVPTG